MTDLAVPEAAPVTLFRSDDPREVIARATDTANALAAVVRAKQLIVRIGQSEHVKVDGWTMLGTLVGVFPVCVWTRPLEDEPFGFEARVEARTRSGEVVGAAEAQCDRSEANWKTRDSYALRSMAQTRATSKALRLPLGFVMTLAGFEATPAEEMPTDVEGSASATPPGAAGNVASSESSATQAQVKKCHTIASKLEKAGVDMPQYAERLRGKYGTSHFSALSKTQASEVIAELEGMERDAAIPF